MVCDYDLRPQWSRSAVLISGGTSVSTDDTRSNSSGLSSSDSGYGGSSPLTSSPVTTPSDDTNFCQYPSATPTWQKSTHASAGTAIGLSSSNGQPDERVHDWMKGLGDSQTPVVPACQRQNKRRTVAVGTANGCPQRAFPPTLTRQDERAQAFVALLVVFTAGLVQAIWPLSAVPPRTDPRFSCGVLPLKTFIQETLRRSKTSYSTLQVALYYLILLKGCLPKRDFTKEQPQDDDCRAFQCGRRMFLSALILASKYLQDRNYSIRAWSKISGLRTIEINRNESKFLAAIDWKLHVPKEKFDRWSRIVLRLSAPPQEGLAPSPCSNLADIIGWDKLIAGITPELPEDFSGWETSLLTPPVSPPSDAFYGSGNNDDQQPPTPHRKTPAVGLSPVCSESSSTGTSRSSDLAAPQQPQPPQLGNLPTPQTTPQTTPVSGFCTPASGPLKSYPRCQDTRSIISSGRRECMARATLERCPPPHPFTHGAQPTRCAPIPRRLSPTGSVSSVSSQGSSPASTMSDTFSVSTRSRSSSMSSNSSFAFGDARYPIQTINPLCGSLGIEPGVEVLVSTRPSQSGEAFLTTHLLKPNENTATAQHKFLPTTTSENVRSLIEMEAASILCHLPQTGSRSISAVCFQSTPENTPNGSQSSESNDKSRPALTAFHQRSSESTPRALQRSETSIGSRSLLAMSRQSSSEMTPKALQCNKTNIGPSKSHKRSHSKVNDALQKEVRKQLQCGTAEVIEIHDDPMDAIHTFNSSPTHKAAQLPYRSWASTKQPIVVPGWEHNKRVAAQPYLGPSALAAMYLQRDLETMSRLNTPVS